MKGTFFSKPLEWSIETQGENWQQGSVINGSLKVKNHGTEPFNLQQAGVAIAYADVKKVHARTEGVLRPEVNQIFSQETIAPGETLELTFSLPLKENCPITDKKGSYFLTYGRQLTENHLMLKVDPKNLFGKIIGLLDTFSRFKLKEVKSAKTGVEYKLIPPTSREMANVESLTLMMAMIGETLQMTFDFQVKKLDTASVTTKINKESIKIKRDLPQKEYSLGRDMINQDQLLKAIESVISEVKMKSVF
jgi:hypothetical protein